MNKVLRNVVLTGTALLLSAVSVLTGVNKDELMKMESVKSAVEAFEADDSYLYIYNNFLGTSKIKYDENRPIQICLSSQFNIEQFNCIKQVVNEFNYLFTAMKSNYKLELYQKDINYIENKDKNIVPIIMANEAEMYSKKIGRTASGTYYGSDGHIAIWDACSVDTSKYGELAKLFAHELMHGFRYADAYLLEYETAPTIMDYIDHCWHGILMENDVLLLAAKVGNLESEEYLDFKDFVKDYCAQKDIEFHYLSIKELIMSEREKLNIPPHISYEEAANMPPHLLNNFLEQEWEKYKIGQILQEHIEQAQIMDEEYIKYRLESFEGKCKCWSLESFNNGKNLEETK